MADDPQVNKEEILDVLRAGPPEQALVMFAHDLEHYTNTTLAWAQMLLEAESQQEREQITQNIIRYTRSVKELMEIILDYSRKQKGQS